MGPLSWSLSEARARCAAGIASLDVGIVHGTPAVLVDCGDESPTGLDALRDLPAVIIAVGTATATDAVDVVVEDPQASVAAVMDNPHAAITLAQVLRRSGDVADTLILESFAYATLQSGPEFAAWLATRGRRVRRPDPTPPILVDRTAAGIELTLNRPRLRNAVSAELRDALVEVLRPLADGGEPVTIRGAGPAFSVGGDLAEFGVVDDPSTAHQIRAAANAAPWFAAVADRLTVEVHGACVGAGIELAAFARHIIATPDATFSLPEVSMGLIPGAGGTVSIPRRIGRHATMRWALEGRALDASEALSLGLVDVVTP